MADAGDKKPPSMSVLKRRRAEIETTLLVITFAVTTASGVFQFAWNEISKKESQRFAAEQERHTRLLQEQQRSLESLKETNSYTLQVHKEVVTALNKKDKRHEAIALALAESLPLESPYRSRLLSVLAAEATDPRIKEVAAFQRDEGEAHEPTRLTGNNPTVHAPASDPTVAIPTATTPSWRVDVFYCGDQREDEAHVVAGVLEQASEPVAEPRVRKLPKAINERAGYSVRADEVRFERSEEPTAKKLQQLLSQQGRTVGLKRISNRTPGYLSLFLCAAGTVATGGHR